MNRMDQSSHEYGHRDGGSDVERTLMMASGVNRVVGEENSAEVSLKSYVLTIDHICFSLCSLCFLKIIEGYGNRKNG